MSYEKYKNHRLAPDDNGCVSVLTDPEYEQVGTYPSKAAAKRAIDEMNPSQPENQLDNDKEELRLKLLAEISDYSDSNNNKAGHHNAVYTSKELLKIVDQYTQSKLKAFAGDIEEAIGEYEYPEQHFPTVLRGENIEKYDKVTARDRLRAELRQALKAIKEKAGIE